MASQKRIVVIGGVASGPSAAARAKRTNPEAEVVLYEQGDRVSYGACEIPYYISGRIPADSAEHLVVLTPEQLSQTRGLKVFTRHRVEAITPREKTVRVKSLEHNSVHEEAYDALILATGARARPLSLEGADGVGVFTVRDLNDAERLRAFATAQNLTHGVVVGGGYIGVEMAEALRDLGLQTTLLTRSGRLLPQMVPDALQPVLQDHMRTNGVTVRNEEPRRIWTDVQGRVKAIETNRGEQIGCQLVIVAVGLAPHVELAVDAGIALGETGAIATDAEMRTNVPNIWACGDCTEVTSVVHGQPVYWPLAVPGHAAARVAGYNAARSLRQPAQTFGGITGASGVRVFGLEIASVGLSEQALQTTDIEAVSATIQHWSRVKIYPDAQPLHVQFTAEKGTGRLLGATLIGTEGAALRVNTLVPLIRERWSVRDMHHLDLVYNPPLAPVRDPLLVAASVVAKQV